MLIFTAPYLSLLPSFARQPLSHVASVKLILPLLLRRPNHTATSSTATTQKTSLRTLLSHYASQLYPQEPLWSFNDLEYDPQRQKVLRTHLEQSSVDDLNFLRWRNALVAQDFEDAMAHLSYGLRAQKSIFGRHRQLVSRFSPSRDDISGRGNESLHERIREKTPTWIIEWLIANKLSQPSQIPLVVDLLRQFPSQESCVMLAQIIIFCISHNILPPLPLLLATLRKHESVSPRILGTVMRALLVDSNVENRTRRDAVKPAPLLSRRLFTAPAQGSGYPQEKYHLFSGQIEGSTGRPDDQMFQAYDEIRLILRTMCLSPSQMRLDAKTSVALLQAKPPMPPATLRLVLSLSREKPPSTQVPIGLQEESIPKDTEVTASPASGRTLSSSPQPAIESGSAIAPLSAQSKASMEEDDPEDSSHSDESGPPVSAEYMARRALRSLSHHGSTASLLSMRRRALIAARAPRQRKPPEEKGSTSLFGDYVNESSPTQRFGSLHGSDSQNNNSAEVQLGVAILSSFAKSHRARNRRHYPSHIIAYFRELRKSLGSDSTDPTKQTPLSLLAWNKLVVVMAKQVGLPAAELLKLAKMVSNMRLASHPPSPTPPQNTPKISRSEEGNTNDTLDEIKLSDHTPTLPALPVQVLPPESGLHTSTLVSCALGLIRRARYEAAYELWSTFLHPRLQVAHTPDWVAIRAGGQALAETGRLWEALELVSETASRFNVSWESDLALKRGRMKDYSRDLRGRKGFEIEGVGDSLTPSSDSSSNTTNSASSHLASFMASYMRTLAHRRRPDVMYALWDALDAPSKAGNDFPLPVQPTNAILNVILLTASVYSTQQCAAHLDQQMGWRLKRSASKGTEASLAHIEDLLHDTSKSSEKDVGFWWGDRPAWQVARDIFREVILGNWPDLANAQSPAHVPTSSALGGGINVVRPLLDFGSSSGRGQSPNEYRPPKTNSSSPMSSGTSPSFDLFDSRPLAIGRYPSIVPNHRSFDAYIRLLCTHGLETEIPEALAWMRELGIMPSQRTIRLALVRYETVGLSAPFDEAVLEPLFSSSREDDRGVIRPGLERAEHGNSPYARLWRWVYDWVGPRNFPMKGSLMVERKLWELRLTRTEPSTPSMPSSTSDPIKQERATSRDYDEYDRGRWEVQRRIRARKAFLYNGKNRRRKVLLLHKPDGTIERVSVRLDLRKRWVGVGERSDSLLDEGS